MVAHDVVEVTDLDHVADGHGTIPWSGDGVKG
jgi:hypothetical protein